MDEAARSAGAGESGGSKESLRCGEEQQALQFSEVPLRIPSTPEDVANLALFLASDAARTITGQSVNVDGGWYMV